MRGNNYAVGFASVISTAETPAIFNACRDLSASLREIFSRKLLMSMKWHRRSGLPLLHAQAQWPLGFFAAMYSRNAIITDRSEVFRISR